MELIEKRKKLAENILLIFSILTLGSGYILYLSLRLLFYEMAKRNILVTLRADGEYKAIMRGDECVRYVMKVENYRIDPDGFDTFKGSFESYAALLVKAAEKKKLEDPGFVERKLKLDDNGNPIQVDGHYQLTNELKSMINEANSSTVFEELFGVVRVGFPPYRVFTYQFRWLKYGQQKAQDSGPSDKIGIFPRDEPVDSLFFRYPQYGVIADNAETGAGSLATATKKDKTMTKVQVRAVFVFETITINPQKTLFRTAAFSSAGDWQQALVREINGHARMWLGSTDWDTLVQDKESVEKALRDICDRINGVDTNGELDPKAQISAVRDYGQRIVKITMPNVDLKDIALQTAYENVFKAEKKRDADMAQAAGDRALAAAPVQGKADGLELIGKIPGGREMFMAEQLGNIRVYAPGRDSLLFNITEEVTGGSPTVQRTKSPTPSGGAEKQ